jgi:hypothetical protein
LCCPCHQPLHGIGKEARKTVEPEGQKVAMIVPVPGWLGSGL